MTTTPANHLPEMAVDPDEVPRQTCWILRQRLQEEGIPLEVAAATAGLTTRALGQRLSRGTLRFAELLALCDLVGTLPSTLVQQAEDEIAEREERYGPAPESAANVVRIVIDVINRRDGSALTFEEVADACGIASPGLATMEELHRMNEHLLDRYARA